MAFGNDLSKALKGLNVNDNDLGDELVIGIDFGTTYTGVAWATKADFETGHLNVITSWPDNGREEVKVPTEIWYSDEGEVAWGYGINADCEPFRWFKLLLLREEDLDQEFCTSSFVTRCRDMMEKCGKTAVDLITDYFRLLWDHIMSTIERACGETVMEALAFHVVITVPAIWKSYARQAMKDAAEASGILDPRLAGDTELTFVPEPEAAALSTLLEHHNGIRTDNVYVVCDAGGGTVDLISYEVKCTKPIVLQEAVEGTGGLCGGIFIDQTFEHMCKGRLGSKWKKLSKMGIGEIMRDQWEYGIKSRFKPIKGAKDYIITLPAEAFSGRALSSLDDTTRPPYIKNGRIYFSSSHIKSAFEDVFAAIDKLLEAQIRSAANKGLSVSGVILVGGLGSSPYLYEYLKAAHSEAGIAVLQSGGMKPRTAICRGAVINGFLGASQNALALISITSTVSRASYGIQYSEDFDSSRHLVQDKYWDKIRGKYLAGCQMRWYLKRGETVLNMKPVRFRWSRLLEQEKFEGTLTRHFYYCEDETPPTRFSDTVHELGELKCDLDVECSDLADFQGADGTMMKKLDYEIELVPSGASVEFVLYINGRRQRNKRARIR